MSDWTLTDPSPDEGSYGIAGYVVLDALGLRLGYVSGWVTDPDECVRMLKLELREWFEKREYLVPVGSITLIDDEHGQVHLRELTKRSIPKYCMAFEDELPESRLLKSLIRFFPNPRPTVVERLERPEEVPALASPPFTIRKDKGIGSRSWIHPGFATGRQWVQLEHLGTPHWMRLKNISDLAWRV